MKMSDDQKRQKTTIRRTTDKVFVTEHSKIERYYTEHESPIIKSKANVKCMWNNDKNENLKIDYRWMVLSFI